MDFYLKKCLFGTMRMILQSRIEIFQPLPTQEFCWSGIDCFVTCSLVYFFIIKLLEYLLNLNQTSIINLVVKNSRYLRLGSGDNLRYGSKNMGITTMRTI
eukprot:TRINITY_DN52681_c1_g1_i3.p4 TRINITY_DN52681_c1_g1~~TRINITY_DN52681_c1_g1_i3.p4  ORF type:complete len:100 (+),score=5.18 TRINITY_DN52681_c1_g1_i3:171-470(+)